VAIYKQAFSLFKSVPILRIFSGSDFDLLLSRIPAEKLQEHLASDQQFFELLTARCQAAGIPIRVRPEQISGLLYTLVMAFFHEDNPGPVNLPSAVDVLMELIAAYCVGEVEL
jgi:hypothetical protein